MLYPEKTVRLAFLSDIHANIQALTSAQRFLSQQRVTQVVVVGDLVGYGASPGPVIDFVQREGWKAVLGSSDLRVSMDLGARARREGVAEQVLEWTRGVLNHEQMEYLRKLPAGGRLNTPLGKVRFFHGSPHDPDQRFDLMQPEDRMTQLARELGARVVVAAGTHVPFSRVVGAGEDAVTFIDPGSVGLSLNREPGADVTILDCSGAQPQVNLHKVPYDYASAAFDILAWQLPPVIADIIKTGRSG